MISRRASLRVLAAGATIAAGLLATGCGGTSVVDVGTPTPVPPPTGYTGAAFTGTVLGGTTPIAGASVELYSAGTTGAGSAPSTLLTAALTTSSAGAFAVPAGYTCASSSSQLYLVARGGALGAGRASNAASAMLLALGPCGAIATDARVMVNEVTTVAGVWAMAQFLGPAGAAGASATNDAGLANAASTSAALVSAATGGTGFPGNGTAPVAKINTLAGLLHLCVVDASSLGCTSLFSLTAGSSAAADTLEAARNLALRPGANVAALFTLLPASPVFSPSLTAAPADWTLSGTYTGGGMKSPGALGVDGAGNVWVASYFGVLSEFSPSGAAVFSSGITGAGLGSSYGLAIDAKDNVWVTNESSDGVVNSARGSVSEFSNAGQPLLGATGFSAGGLNYPVGIAIDANGTVWVVNYGNASVTLLDGTGKPLSGAAGYPVTGSAFPVSVALDAAHNGWIGDQNDATLTRIAADGTQIRNYACCNAPAGLAIDQSGATWAANFSGASVSRIANGQMTVYTGGGLSQPQGVAIDGAGRVWVANYGAPGVTELAGSTDAQPGAVLSPAAGWVADGNVQGAFALRIDASGNLWVSGFNDNTLREIIGLAAPVKTPLLGPPQAP